MTNALLPLLGRLDRRLVTSVAIVGAIVGSLYFVGQTSAVVLAVESCAPSPTAVGNDVVCELSLTIQNGERIPVQNLEFQVTGPVSFNVSFDVNAVGTGAPSDSSEAVTPSLAPQPLAAPGAPASVIAEAGNRQAKITWAAPNNDGGSAVIGYVVISDPDSPNSPMIGDNVLTSTMTELTNGTSYTFTVSAINSVGVSAPTATSNQVTPGGVEFPFWVFILIPLGVITVFAIGGLIYLRKASLMARV